MLVIDGGGIRGLLTLGMLPHLEELLAAKSGRDNDFRLCEYFDYISGTSTGAIIAAGLARGMSVAQLIKFYQDYGTEIFAKSGILKRLNSLYTADPLRQLLRRVFNADDQGNYDPAAPDQNLLPEHLKCLLMIATRNGLPHPTFELCRVRCQRLALCLQPDFHGAVVRGIGR